MSFHTQREYNELQNDLFQAPSVPSENFAEYSRGKRNQLYYQLHQLEDNAPHVPTSNTNYNFSSPQVPRLDHTFPSSNILSSHRLLQEPTSHYHYPLTLRRLPEKLA